MTVKEYVNSLEEMSTSARKTLMSYGQKPTEITPSGPDAKSQWYLYDEIRPFRSNNLAKDITCPKPSVERPDIR